MPAPEAACDDRARRGSPAPSPRRKPGSRQDSQTDAKSQTTTLTYDSIGRLSTKANPTETVTTTYSQARSGFFNTGRATTVASSLGNGTLQFDYDALGRVVKQTRTIDGTNYTVQKDYDTAGYLRGMQYPDGDIIGQFGGSGTALGYDQAGRLSSIPGILTSVTYNALGAPLVQTNANGTTTTKTYDANRFWLKTIGTTSPSLTLQNLSYTLNDAGMATQVTSPFGTEGWTYGYDDLNRLTSSTNTGAPANDQTWTYDSLGRITNNSRIGNYTYGSSRPHAVTAAGSNTYTSYDNNGNLLLGGGRTLTWDANNLVTQVVMGGNTTTFTYGPDGDRIKKASSSTTLRYPFGDDYEINGSTVTKYFNAGFGVIAKKVGTTLYWLHTDRMGSINATTDGSGAEVLRRSYRSYGELLGQTGTDTESLGYIGQRTDSETGLTYLHARYYDSGLGMFLSPDPAGADSNTYRYSGGDPVNSSDPSGLCRDGEVCMPAPIPPTVPQGPGPFPGPNPGPGSPGPGAPCVPPLFRGIQGIFPENCDPPDNPPDCSAVPTPDGCPGTPEPDCSLVPKPQGCDDGTDGGCPAGFAAMGLCGNTEEEEHPQDPAKPADPQREFERERPRPQTCSFRSKFGDNMSLLHHSSFEAAAHVYHFGEAAFGAASLLVGTQVLSNGLAAGTNNILAIETGTHLVAHAGATIPHIVIGMGVVEAGFMTGSFLNATYSVLSGSCQ